MAVKKVTRSRGTKKAALVIRGVRLTKLKLFPLTDPVGSFWVEYSTSRGQVVGTIFDRRTNRAMFTISGSDEYTKQTTRGLLKVLERAECRERLEDFFNGGNDNHQQGGIALGGRL